MYVTDAGEVQITDLDLFLGREYLITVQEGECPILRASMDQFHTTANQSRSDELFYKIMDGRFLRTDPGLVQ